MIPFSTQVPSYRICATVIAESCPGESATISREAEATAFYCDETEPADWIINCKLDNSVILS